ncbi:MAG: hypothetical protein ACI4B5_06550 [Bacteroidaceae bacterium]
MKKNYIAPEMMVAEIQVESMIALSAIDSPADGSDALVKGDVEISGTGGASRGNSWDDQW